MVWGERYHHWGHRGAVVEGSGEFVAERVREREGRRDQVEVRAADPRGRDVYPNTVAPGCRDVLDLDPSGDAAHGLHRRPCSSNVLGIPGGYPKRGHGSCGWRWALACMGCPAAARTWRIRHVVPSPVPSGCEDPSAYRAADAERCQLKDAAAIVGMGTFMLATLFGAIALYLVLQSRPEFGIVEEESW